MKSPQKRLAQGILAEAVLGYLGREGSGGGEYFKMSHQELKAKDRGFFEELFKGMKDSGSYYTLSKD